LKIAIVIGVIILSSLIIPTFAEDEVTIEYLRKEPKLSKAPIVCIYEPNEPLARQVIKDEWMRKTEKGIKSWEYTLMDGEDKIRDKWRIDIIKITLEKQEKFDNSFCNVEVRFTGKPNTSHPGGVGWERFDGERSQIMIFYMTKEICEYVYDSKKDKANQYFVTKMILEDQEKWETLQYTNLDILWDWDTTFPLIHGRTIDGVLTLQVALL